MVQNDFNKQLEQEIQTISIEAKSRGFGVSKEVVYKTDFTTIVAHAFHIPDKNGKIHHFDLKINKYKRKKATEQWEPVIDEVEEHFHGDFQSLKIDAGNGVAVKKLTEFLNAQYAAIGTKIEKKKVIIDNPEDIDLSLIKKLDPNKLKNIDSLVSVTRLENIISDWEKNKENDDENFWQQVFQNNAWILSQIFSCPFILIGKKFYCGGKEDDDKGGVKGDLLYKNDLTGNLAFIEIKTPKKLLVGGIYRGEKEGKENIIHSINDEVTGGINQVLNQRKVYLQTHGDNNGKFLHNAKCILIIGTIGILNSDQKKSLELFRSYSKDVEIISFDELFGKIKTFLSLLKE